MSEIRTDLGLGRPASRWVPKEAGREDEPPPHSATNATPADSQLHAVLQRLERLEARIAELERGR